MESISKVEFKAMKFLNYNEKLKIICSNLLNYYLTSSEENKALFKVLSKIIPIVNPEND